MRSDLTRLPPEGNVVNVNGIEMYYELAGDGPPLLLLHNFTASGQFWQPFLDAFAGHYRLIVPDLRGHGRSTNPANQFTHRQSASDIFALLDHLKINRFRALGVSSGGMTLIHIATRLPDRVEAMALIGSTIYFSAQTRSALNERSPDSDLWDWDSLRQRHVYGDVQIRALLTQFHNFKDSYEDMNFTGPYLSTITAPTLIVHGDRDFFFPVSIPLEMYRWIPDAYLWIIPNGGHIPITDKLAPLFSQTALDFLAGRWAQIG